MTGPIDVMNYGAFIAPGLTGPEYRYPEFQTMVQTTFKSLVRDGQIETLWGRSVPIDGDIDEDRTLGLDRAFNELDRTGVETVVLVAMKMWSLRTGQMMMNMPQEVVAEAVSKGGGRFIGAASYNPFEITASLAEIDIAVQDLGFKYVYFHPMTFGLQSNDRRCYPLYAKCAQLGIPVGVQVGHSAEPIPSDVGRPMHIEEVAVEFPTLRINLSHTGWPWTGEFISVLWRYPNVYGDLSAYFPCSLEPSLVKAMDGQIRRKIMFGTNGLEAARWLKEFDDLPLRDASKSRILRDNAVDFLEL